MDFLFLIYHIPFNQLKKDKVFTIKEIICKLFCRIKQFNNFIFTATNYHQTTILCMQTGSLLTPGMWPERSILIPMARNTQWQELQPVKSLIPSINFWGENVNAIVIWKMLPWQAGHYKYLNTSAKTTEKIRFIPILQFFVFKFCSQPLVVKMKPEKTAK